MTKKNKFTFFTLLFTGFIDYLGIGLVYPIFAPLLFDPYSSLLPFHASAEYRGAVLGLLLALTPLTQFFCAPLLGAYSDSHGRKPALLLGIGLGCLGYALAVIGLFFHFLPLLFLYRILVGVSDATAAVAQASLVDISDEKNKAKRFSYLNSALGLGFTVGPFLGGFIADPAIVSWFTFSTPLIVAGCLSLCNLLLVLLKLPETHTKKRTVPFDVCEGLRSIKKVFSLKSFKWLFLAGFTLSFGWSFFNEFIPVFLKAHFGFSLASIGRYYAMTGIWYALGAFLAARLITKWSAEKTALSALMITSACMLLFLSFSMPFFIWMIIPIMMMSLACVYPTASTLVSNRASESVQGEILGIYQSVGAAAMGLSPLIVGSAVGAYPSLTAWGGALFMGLTAVSFLLDKRKVEVS